jgi:hypothetical protein
LLPQESEEETKALGKSRSACCADQSAPPPLSVKETVEAGQMRILEQREDEAEAWDMGCSMSKGYRARC